MDYTGRRLMTLTSRLGVRAPVDCRVGVHNSLRSDGDIVICLTESRRRSCIEDLSSSLLLLTFSVCCRLLQLLVLFCLSRLWCEIAMAAREYWCKDSACAS